MSISSSSHPPVRRRRNRDGPAARPADRAGRQRWLRFTPALEARYQADTWPAHWRHLLVCALIGHAGIYGGVLNDAATVPDLAGRLLPMWLLASLFAFVVQAGGWLLIPHPRRRAWQMDLLNLIAMVPYAGLLIWSTTTSPVLSATLRSINLVPMMLWVCILGRLQFPFALATSLAMLAGFVLRIDGPTPLHQQIFWSNAKILALATVVSLVTNFVLERRERRTWLLRRIAARQRRAIEQAGEELRHLSMTDALTGVANRRRLEHGFDAAWAQAQALAGGGAIGLLQIDVDHFKRFNDHHGHPAGDTCLRAVAAALDEVARQRGGLLARTGGEEFTLMLPGHGLDAARAAAEAACDAVRAAGIAHHASPLAAHVTVSVGAATLRARTGLDAPGARHLLVSLADRALYDAKNAGRDRACALDAGHAAAPALPAAAPAEAAHAPPESPHEAVLRGGFRLLAFPPAIEADYQSAQQRQRRLLLGLTAFFGTLLFTLYAFTNNGMTADIDPWFWSWRLAAAGVMLAAGVVVLLPVGPRTREAAFALGVATVAVVCLAGISHSRAPTLYAAYVSVLLIPLVACNAARTPVRFTLIPGGATLGTFLFVIDSHTPLQHAMALDATTMMLTATALTLLAGYLLERSERTDYLLGRIHQQQHEALTAATQALRALSAQDPLTGLPNRRQFELDFEHAWHEAGMRPVSLLIADVDFFKRYNDHHGHPAGDACLSRVAQVLAQLAEACGGRAARLGGEEFALLLPGHDAARAADAARRLCAAVRAAALPHADSDVGPHVTVSVGAATRVPGAHDSRHQLMAAADDALYRAKREGRDRTAAASRMADPGTRLAGNPR